MSGAARLATEKADFRPALPMSFLPGISEMQMATMTYREQLLHPNWQRKRLDILNRDDFACQLCHDKESTLHVHHKQYAKGRMAWEYPNDELVTLCEECHDTMHEQQGMLRDVTAKLPVDGPAGIDNARSLLAGWANGSQGLDFSPIFQEDPHNYVVGEVAHELERHLGLDHLFALLSALRKAPRWVVHEELKRFSDALNQNADKPAPKSYTRAMGEGLDDL